MTMGTVIRVVRRGLYVYHRIDVPILTQREIEVLQWMADGKKHDDMALLMGISANAVQQYCHRIRNKLGTQTNMGSVAAGIRKGIIK